MASKKRVAMVPTFDNVMVRRDEADEWSQGVGGGKGKILMAPGAAEKPKRGLCVAVGPGRYDNKAGAWIYPPCKAGDIVFVRHWNGADVLVNGVKHEIFNSAEVIGVETNDLEVIRKAYGEKAPGETRITSVTRA